MGTPGHVAAKEVTMPTMGTLNVLARTQELVLDAAGHNIWRVIETRRELDPARTAIVVCDMWNRHWSRGASERVDEMAPRMDAVLVRARAHGARVIHAPSDTMPFYAGTLARQRMLDAPPASPPPLLQHVDPPLPFPVADPTNSDTNESKGYCVWTSQHPAIAIDQERDAISDDGREVFNYLAQCHVAHVLVMGVHTNMCVLGRSFAIKALVRWGLDVMLVRDLTDAMCNPAQPPYVEHWDGTRLVIAYIEKWWCPTIDSGDLM
jgi:nicotinamidase-related amidase